ncbi:MAG TPA: alpha-galactosidase [Thermoflexales bacterium]|nr:alpha-galactosidase [Thermoflexales bacterium]
MIHFDPSTRTFNLILKTSFYAFQVDETGVVVHLAHGPRPANAPSTAQVTAKATLFMSDERVSFEHQLRRDELVTFGDTTYHEVALKVAFPSLPASIQPGEAAHLPIRDVRLRYAGHEIVTDARPGLSANKTSQVPGRTCEVCANPSERQTLRVFLRDPAQPFRAALCYRLTPEHDIIERWVELENTGEVTITVEACASATMHLPNGANELTSVTGLWGREFTTQREAVPMGLRILESRMAQGGHESSPFFFLNRPGQAWEETGAVWFGALELSGGWRIAVEHLPSLDVRVHAGYNPFDFELALAPGQKHITPALACGVSNEGWGGASRRLHAFARERILPAPKPNAPLRPVLYNSWEATYFNLSVAGQTELARKAAAIGVELFCLDDGWFGARRNDHAGLGDWVVSRDVFPDGLAPLVAEVRKLGMKFGLWVEPEMVNPDSDLYRAHPDWILHFAGRPRTEQRNQLVLDFGRDEVVEHIFAALNKLCDEYQIDFFKWDMNRNPSEPGSVAGKAIWRKHTAGVYSVMDRLRAAHPELDIQSCSGGGGRIDLGVLQRADQVWTSDNTDALDRIRIQEGFSLAYPARAMECWVTHERNHQTHTIHTLAMRFDVAMRGALGIGSSLNALDEAELAEYASFIAFYKRIRPIVQNGELYRLQRQEEFGASIIQYVLADGSEAVYSVAVSAYLMGQHLPTPPLRGLDAAATYAACNRTGTEVYRASGYELMTLGIPWLKYVNVQDTLTLHVKKV